MHLAEAPLAPRKLKHPVSLRLTTGAGTLGILDADPATLDRVLWIMLHAEQCHRLRLDLHRLRLYGSTTGHRRPDRCYPTVTWRRSVPEECLVHVLRQKAG